MIREETLHGCATCQEAVDLVCARLLADTHARVQVTARRPASWKKWDPPTVERMWEPEQEPAVTRAFKKWSLSEQEREPA